MSQGQSGSVQFNSDSLTNILIILVVVGLGIYVFFELKSIKSRLSTLESSTLMHQSPHSGARPPSLNPESVHQTLPTPL